MLALIAIYFDNCKPKTFSVIIHTEIKTKEDTMASNIASAAMWAAVFTPTADEIAKEIVAEEARLREIEEKAYWEAYWKAWDRGCKEKVIQRLRNHEEGLNFLTLQKQPIYPDMTQDEQADLIERGELKIVAPTKEGKGIGLIWADTAREEAKNPRYIDLKTLLDELVSNGHYRVIS